MGMRGMSMDECAVFVAIINVFFLHNFNDQRLVDNDFGSKKKKQQ